MDFAASKHICRNREIFCTLKTNGEFNHFKLGNDGKMKVEGIGSVRMKFHDGAIWTFSNVRFVTCVDVNIIYKGEMTSQGYKYVGSKWGCKVYKGRHLVLQRHKNKGNLCYLDEQVLKRNHNIKMKKKVKFSNVVEVLGDTLVGQRVSSLSNWSKNIYLLTLGREL